MGLVILIELFIKQYGFFPDLNDENILNEIYDQNQAYVNEEIKKRLPGMWITDWDIWHVYSSYFNENVPNLYEVANNLVKEGLCPLVFHPNGTIWYSEDKTVKKSFIDVQNEKKGEMSVKFDKRPSDYILECIGQSYETYHAEKDLLNGKYLKTFPYIRGFLNACYLKKDERTIALYPQLKIYRNGVLEILFREIGQKGFEYEVNLFNKNDARLSTLEFDNIEFPPEAIKLFSRHDFSYYSIKNRFLDYFNFKPELKITDEIIDENTRSYNESVFSFNLTPFDSNNETKLYLDDLFEVVISAIIQVMNNSNNKLFPLKNNKNYSIGDYFTLRPVIYILEYIGQPKNKNKIVEKFGTELGKIMAGNSKLSTDYEKFLGKDLREYEDYTLHLNSGRTLYTYSKKGLDSIQKIDPNRGKIIYQKQVQNEAIDHLFISHKRLFLRASNQSIPLKYIIAEQEALFELEGLITDKISPYGEIVNLYNYAGDQLKWDDLRISTEKMLNLREKLYNQKIDKELKNFGFVIAVLFGLFGVSSFVDKVTIPIWDYYELSLPFNIPELKTTFLYIITTLIVLLVIYIYWKLKINRK